MLYSDGDQLGMGNRSANEVFMILAPLATRTVVEFIKALEDRTLGLKALHHTAQGLCYIHSCGIIHRDIKPSNLLIAHPFRVLVADFGHSSTERTSRDHRKGTIAYLPPEIMDLKHSSQATSYWSTASDVFAFGIVAYEVLHGPFPRCSAGFVDATSVQVVLSQLQVSQEEIDAMIGETLSANPSERPNLKEICLRRFWLEPETPTISRKRSHAIA